MLTLRLKPGEYLVIGEDITIQVFEKKRNYLEVAVEAPKDISVLRGEVYEQNNPRPPFLRENRSQTLCERNANIRRRETLARREDAARQLNTFLDGLESRNPELEKEILTMREQISRLNGETKA
ncbi:carbon storage regulator [Acutalibacter sp. 1XD8-36]|uniref:carbon storage regulator n=1 Tax=Acutalibacter sp. 1XD8-36 TaxID=2320852 RepID=UPI00262E1847|nr:carbon storage regulator [Acutalibacter sp. 1XD8-36]